jgi:hypothetical protein
VYRARGAVVGENFSQIGEYSSTVKNRQKCASVPCRVSLKGLMKDLSRKAPLLIISQLKGQLTISKLFENSALLNRADKPALYVG